MRRFLAKEVLRQDIEALVAEVRAKNLWQQINDLAPTEIPLFEILDKARKARNAIAHEIAIGLDSPIISESDLQSLRDMVGQKTLTIAEADRAVSLIASLLTDESIPDSDFLREYPDRVHDWVAEL